MSSALHKYIGAEFCESHIITLTSNYRFRAIVQQGWLYWGSMSADAGNWALFERRAASKMNVVDSRIFRSERS